MTKVTLDLDEFDQLREYSRTLKRIKDELATVSVNYYPTFMTDNNKLAGGEAYVKLGPKEMESLIVKLKDISN